MVCRPSPFPKAVLAEASRIAPHRRTTSDGICGDAAHRAKQSDHNPDSRGIPHAVDISQDPGVFDAHAYGLLIAHRIAIGTERRVKYLVSNYGHGDVIFDPSVSFGWRHNATGNEHVSHLHVSFTVAAEQSTAPFFGSTLKPPEVDMPLNGNDEIIIRNIVKQEITEFIGGINSSGEAFGPLATIIKHYTGPLADAIARLPKT